MPMEQHVHHVQRENTNQVQQVAQHVQVNTPIVLNVQAMPISQQNALNVQEDILLQVPHHVLHVIHFTQVVPHVQQHQRHVLHAVEDYMPLEQHVLHVQQENINLATQVVQHV